MGKKGDNSVPETPQQAAMVERAQSQLQDYEQRWLHLQQNLAKQIQDLGTAGSPTRLRAEGRATTETEAKFSQARGAVENSLTSAGAGPGSSKFKLAVTGMGADEATSKGLGMLASDQAINDAYTQGLGALTAVGRGEKTAALQGASDIAAMSGRQASQDAALSMQSQAGTAALVGQVAGVGLSRLGAPATNSKTYFEQGGGVVGPNFWTGGNT